MKKRLYIPLVFLLGVAQATAQTTDNEWYLTALGAYQQDNLSKAKNAFTKIRELEPEMLHLQAKVYLRSNQPDSAIHVLQELSLPETSWLLALSYAQKKQVEESIKHLRQYLKFKGKRSEAEIKLHEGLEPIKNTKAWNDLWLKDWYSHHEKTIAEIKYLLKQENFFAAIDTLTDKIEEFPEYADYLYYLSKAYSQIGKHDQALKYIDRAVEMERTIELYRLQRGKVYVALEEWEDAIDDFTYYLRINPGAFEVYLELAEVYGNNEEPQDAIRELDEYLSYLPLDREGLKLKANIAYNSGDYLTTLSTINLYFKHYDPEEAAYKLRGLAYYHANMADYAERDLSQALDYNPNDAEVYYYRGLARMSMDKKEAACSDFKKSYQMGYREAYNKLHEYCEN